MGSKKGAKICGTGFFDELIFDSSRIPILFSWILRACAQMISKIIFIVSK